MLKMSCIDMDPPSSTQGDRVEIPNPVLVDYSYSAFEIGSNGFHFRPKFLPPPQLAMGNIGLQPNHTNQLASGIRAAAKAAHDCKPLIG